MTSSSAEFVTGARTPWSTTYPACDAIADIVDCIRCAHRASFCPVCTDACPPEVSSAVDYVRGGFCSRNSCCASSPRDLLCTGVSVIVEYRLHLIGLWNLLGLLGPDLLQSRATVSLGPETQCWTFYEYSALCPALNVSWPQRTLLL